MAQGLPKGQEQKESAPSHSQNAYPAAGQIKSSLTTLWDESITKKITFLQGSSALRMHKKELKNKKITFLGKWYHAVTLCLGIHLTDVKLAFGKNEQNKWEA